MPKKPPESQKRRRRTAREWLLGIEKTPEQLQAEKRKKISEKLFDGRAEDRSYRFTRKGGFRHRLGWPRHRDVRSYESTLKLRGKKPIVRIVQDKLREKSGKIDVLDVGCGAGVFLSELKAGFGKDINAEGITLASPLSPKGVEKLGERVSKGGRVGFIDRLALKKLEIEGGRFHTRAKEGEITVHTGMAETHDYGRKYDLVFSVESIMHTVNPLMVLTNTINHLKAGGDAYLHTGIGRTLRDKRTISFLEAQGVRVERLGHSAYHLQKTRETSVSYEELQEFRKKEKKR